MDNQNQDENSTISKESTPEKIGAWRGGWLLAKASWSTLKLDKELVLFPILSALSIILIIGLIVGVALLSGVNLNSENPPAFLSNWYSYLYAFIVYLVIFTTTSFFSASIISSALCRFKGGNPTIKYGLGEARKRFGSLFKFSLLAATVGLVLRMIEEKSGIVGKIFAIITDIAWGIASLFAIPVIVSNDKPIGPVQTLRESAGVFKKVWAKNYTGGLTMGVVFLLAFFLWLVFSGIIIGASIAVSPILLFVTAPILAIALIIIISISSALTSIFQAALYHYAQTGESPVHFEKQLLQAAFKPKKGWFA